ncbi:MAG: hypothetical protein ACYTG3_02970 [Planctomycetota bacterium]|jgi:hypothetical protein
MKRPLACALLAAAVAAGCSPAKRTGYLPSYSRLSSAEHIDKYWSDGSLGRHKRIAVTKSELFEIEDRKGVTARAAEAWLLEALVRQPDADQPFLLGRAGGGGSATMEIALTRLRPGGRWSRVWIGEFGAGQADAQIEGRILADGEVIALFAHRNRSAAPKSNDYADLKADQGAVLLKREIEACVADLRRQLTLEYLD